MKLVLREKGWNTKDSLLMDGGNENLDINLRKVIFWPDNIISLFQRFNVRERFDLLSVDTDSYDWFMLEKILENNYRPRVIIIEHNSMIDLNESKSIHPPTEGEQWANGIERLNGSRSRPFRIGIRRTNGATAC